MCIRDRAMALGKITKFHKGVIIMAVAIGYGNYAGGIVAF